MVKSATRALQILKAVGSSKDGMKHNQIAGALDIPKGSLSFLLADLVSEGFLRTDSTGRCYRIGPQVLSLAGRYLASLDIVKLSSSIIRELVARNNETAGLAVKMGWEVTIVCKENSPDPFKWDLDIGTRFSMHSTAAGKAILAHLRPDEIRAFFKTVPLDAKTDRTITDRKTLISQFEVIRRTGLACANEEQYEGMIGLAGPVFDNEGRVTASVVQPVPLMKFNPDKERLIRQVIREACARLSFDLGYQVPDLT